MPQSAGVANTGVPVPQGFHLPHAAAGTAAHFFGKPAVLIDFDARAEHLAENVWRASEFAAPSGGTDARQGVVPWL